MLVAVVVGCLEVDECVLDHCCCYGVLVVVVVVACVVIAVAVSCDCYFTCC